MTEAEWLACSDLPPMLNHVQQEASDRKLRLLAIACHRRFEPLLIRSSAEEQLFLRKPLSVSERYADGDADLQELTEAFDDLARRFGTYEGPHMWRDIVSDRKHMLAGLIIELWRNWELVNHFMTPENPLNETEERLHQLQLVHDIFGNPFRPVALSPEWRTDTALALSRTMYDQRDFSAMPILADALQDAGCDNDDILNHCRGPGPHVRGCWVVDLVLGK